jgi:calcineurin-like phosphoesterase family protein
MIAGLYDIFEHWHKQGTVWMVSDTHFDDEELYIGTKNIKRNDTDEYVKLINSKVGKNDTLIHLGDCGNLEAIAKIRGYKILIMGNHDQGASKFKRQTWNERFDATKYDKKDVISIMKKKYPNCIIRVSEKIYDVQHAPFIYYFAIADNNLFNEVYTGPVQIGEKLILSHEPLECGWAFNIHGHIHSFTHKDDARHMCICPEVTRQFEPINFNQLMKSGFMSKIETQHRKTIDSATKRARKRGKKK